MQSKVKRYVTTDKVLDEVENRITQIKSVLIYRQNAVTKAPKGNVKILKTSQKIQFYVIDQKGDTNGKYVSKDKQKLISAIIQRQYDEKALKELKKELKLLQKLKDSYKPEFLEKLFNNLSELRKKSVEPVILEQSEAINKWLAMEYKGKSFYEHEPFLTTAKGLRVRSKSEVIIADALSRQKIPFRYEYPIRMSNYTVYPDFYCLNTKTGQEIIWEHFGLLEDSEYASNAVEKLQNYQRKGYHLGKNLIISVESRNHPMSSSLAESIIGAYF